MNPVRGGRPPSERRIRGVKEVRMGALVHDVERVLMVVASLILKTRKVENVITRYVMSVKTTKSGEN